MHQSLCIDEILRIIFAHAAGSKHDLTCLARVCKGWKDPALDVVWERLPSLQPLLSLIPNLTKSGKTYTRISALLEKEIQTLRFYSSKVRNIVHSEFAIFDADKFSIFFDAASNPSQLLLPFLQHSKISCKLWTQHHSAFLLSTNLRYLDIDFNRVHLGQHTTDFYSVMKQALIMADNLRELHIRGVLSEEFEELIPHMRRIHRLSLRVGASLTPSSFSIIARLPNVSELTIHLDKLNTEDLDLDLDTPLFPSILNLQLRGNSNIFQPLLSRLPTNQISYLWLEAMDNTHDDVEWNDVIASVSSLGSTSLEELVLEHHVELPQQDEPQTLDTTTDTGDQSPMTPTPTLLSFKSFCKLHALQRLQLEMTVPPTCEESDIADLVEGCPKLKHINLGGTSGSEYYGVMFSLKENTLRNFTKFQNLESLVLPSAYMMDASIPLPQPDTRHLSVLRSLTLGKTSALDGTNLAKHLIAIFPHLKEISGASVYNILWDSTNVELFRLTREIMVTPS